MRNGIDKPVTELRRLLLMCRVGAEVAGKDRPA
jgi:hypothetical protein